MRSTRYKFKMFRTSSSLPTRGGGGFRSNSSNNSENNSISPRKQGLITLMMNNSSGSGSDTSSIPSSSSYHHHRNYHHNHHHPHHHNYGPTNPHHHHHNNHHHRQSHFDTRSVTTTNTRPAKQLSSVRCNYISTLENKKKESSAQGPGGGAKEEPEEEEVVTTITTEEDCNNQGIPMMMMNGGEVLSGGGEANNNNCGGGDVRSQAFAICRDYLHGVWKQIDGRDLIVKRISGGLSNYLYHCSLPPTLTPLYTEPTQVLLRFYGQVHGEGALESLITESVIFTLLSERKLGPRLYGVFPGGRVEEFIPARPLLTHELKDPELTVLIAQKMAQVHALNIPISKEPSWLWGTMDRWMVNAKECLGRISNNPQKDISPEVHLIVEKLKGFNLPEELEWLKKYLPQVGSPVVFCHNDMQEGNILIRPEYEGPEDKLVLIDFEYCSYNYRGFDLANHFCEWGYNYNVDLHPNYMATPDNGPTLAEKLRFIRRYITILREEYRLNFPEAAEDEQFLKENVLFDEAHILLEVKSFVLASHFLWGLWSIVNAQVSKIPFGYWEYALTRFQAYLDHKNSLMQMRMDN